MDLIPTPDQVVSAAANLAQRVLRGGLADLEPMPRTLLDEGERRRVFCYRPTDHARASDPVLLVSPLAAPALAYDLRRGCSLVEHLVESGRPTYLVEYGEVSFSDRDLSIEPWVRDVLPAAVRAVSADAGDRPVHVVGWSLGGIFAILAAAADSGLPIASLALLATPFDVHQVPLVAPARPLLDLAAGLAPVTRALEAVRGTAEVPLVGWASQLSSFQRLVTKPLALASHLDDGDYLAQIEAVDRFSAAMTAYRGRTFGQVYHRLLGDSLVAGRATLGTRTVSVADVAQPLLVLAGATDQIAPLAAVKAGVSLATGSRDPRFEIVPGGHLGMLTGREARTGTWRVLDSWVEEWADLPAATPRRTATKAAARRTPAAKATAKKASARKTAVKKAPVKRTAVTKAAAPKTAAAQTPAKKAPAKKAPTKKAPAKKAPAKKATTKKAPAAATTPEPVIGANTSRRYGSAGSRALRRPTR